MRSWSMLLVVCSVALIACDGGDGGGDDAGPEPMTGPDPAAHCPPRDPVDCAEDIGGWIPNRREGSTFGRPDDYSGSRCGVGGGLAVEDIGFRWTAPRDGLFRFTTAGSGFNTVLSVRRGSCAGREIACNDDALDGSTYSAVAIELEECETVTVVVDGYDLDGVGPFVVQVDTSEASCTDGEDDDGDGLTDCDDPDCFGPRCTVESGDWPEEWAALEAGVLEAVNEQRALGAVCDGVEYPPAGPLVRDTLLELSARRHSLDMAELGYFDHVSQDGRTLGDRTAAVGYESPAVGENIGQGYETVDQVMAGWMSSPGHCVNIMTASWDDLGVGYAYPEGASGPYWTQNFGSR